MDFASALRTSHLCVQSWFQWTVITSEVCARNSLVMSPSGNASPDGLVTMLTMAPIVPYGIQILGGLRPLSDLWLLPYWVDERPRRQLRFQHNCSIALNLRDA